MHRGSGNWVRIAIKYLGPEATGKTQKGLSQTQGNEIKKEVRYTAMPDREKKHEGGDS